MQNLLGTQGELKQQESLGRGKDQGRFCSDYKKKGRNGGHGVAWETGPYPESYYIRVNTREGSREGNAGIVFHQLKIVSENNKSCQKERKGTAPFRTEAAAAKEGMPVHERKRSQTQRMEKREKEVDSGD